LPAIRKPAAVRAGTGKADNTIRIAKKIESLDTGLVEVQSQCRNAEWNSERLRAHRQVFAFIREYEAIRKILDCHEQTGVKP